MLRLVATLLLAAVLACSENKPEVVVAAAANLIEPFHALGPEFERATGIHPVFTFASTAELAQQIENGAPYDVFTAADRVHVDQLAHGGLLESKTIAIYTEGVLALWVPPDSKAHINRLQDLAGADVHVVSIAKPDLAPYGEAAVTALKRAGLWDQVRPKIIYGQNISMAKQYGATGNADAVLTAYSLVLHEQGTVVKVDPALYAPISQGMAVLAHAPHPENAAKFAEYLLHSSGQTVLRQFGYQPPHH